MCPTGLVGLLFLIQLATNQLQPEAQLAKAKKQCDYCKFARKSLCKNFTIPSSQWMQANGWAATWSSGDQCVDYYENQADRLGASDYCYSSTPFCGCHFDATSLAKKQQNIVSPSKCYPFQYGPSKSLSAKPEDFPLKKFLNTSLNPAGALCQCSGPLYEQEIENLCKSNCDEWV